jgi:hypothetical protein
LFLHQVTKTTYHRLKLAREDIAWNCTSRGAN